MGNGLSSPLPVLTLPPWLSGSTPPKVFENTILMAAAEVPVLLALAPLAVGVVSRSVDRVLHLLCTPSLWGAVMNSIIWVLFAFIATKRIECLELILAYPMLLVINFTYLLLVYGYHNRKWMAAWLSILVVSCLGYVFYAIKFEASLPMTCETILGNGGLVILLYSHVSLIEDLKDVVGAVDYAIAVLNIVPPGLLNMATCYVILKNHPEQQYIAYSALIGFFGAMMEIMCLIKKAALNMFVGDDNGPPAVPPGPALLHAQAAAASAAQAESAAARANHIAETLLQLQAATRQQLNNVDNSGEDLRGILVQTAVERPAGGLINSNTAQDVGCVLFQGGVDLGDSKDAPSLKKDLLIRKLSEELITVSKETVELEKNPTELPQSGTDDRGAAELEEAKSATEFHKSGSSGESKRRKKSQVLATDVPSGGRCAPSGWKKYFFRDARLPTC